LTNGVLTAREFLFLFFFPAFRLAPFADHPCSRRAPSYRLRFKKNKLHGEDGDEYPGVFGF